MRYGASVRTSRMQAVAAAMTEGSRLEIGTANMGLVLVRIDLKVPAATVDGDTLTLRDLPVNGRGLARGVPREARIVDSSGEVVVEDLTVGTGRTDIVLDRDFISVGQMVVIEAPCTIRHAGAVI